MSAVIEPTFYRTPGEASAPAPKSPADPRSALRWGHGDGLVLRRLSELPAILSP
jgi:hypothetical protein